METIIKKLLLVFSLALLVMGSCKKEPLGPDIYLAGRFVTDINDVYYGHAAYWKNGKLYPLDESAVESEAMDIEVENAKVNVAGRVDYKPCIWVDGQKKELSPLNGIARGLQVKEGISYISGYIGTNEFGSDRACLWILYQDGQLKQVLLENEASYAADVIFEGETLLVSGTFKGSPCYWKWTPASKIRIDLGPKKGFNRKLMVHNNEVFISGAYDTDNDGQLPYSIGYWKGTNFIYTGHDLYPNTEFDSGLAFDEVGQLYQTGNLYSGPGEVSAHYFKNGQLFKLSDQAAARCIAILNTDVYIAGLVVKNTESQACYWKNGILNKLNTPKSAGYDIELVD